MDNTIIFSYHLTCRYKTHGFTTNKLKGTYGAKQASAIAQGKPCRSVHEIIGLIHNPGKDAVGHGGTTQSWVEAKSSVYGQRPGFVSDVVGIDESYFKPASFIISNDAFPAICRKGIRIPVDIKNFVGIQEEEKGIEET